MFWMSALDGQGLWMQQCWGSCSPPPALLLWLGGFSPLTSAESHLLDHGSHPHWPSDYCLHSIFPHDLNYSLVFPTSTFLMATYLPSIFNNDNDQKKKKSSSDNEALSKRQMCLPFGPTISLWELCNTVRKRYKYAKDATCLEKSYARAQQCLRKAQMPRQCCRQQSSTANCRRRRFWREQSSLQKIPQQQTQLEEGSNPSQEPVSL